MKKIFILVLFLLSFLLNAQSPNLISYRAIAKKENGDLIVGTNINVRISILDNSATGNVLYIAVYPVVTNSIGAYNIQIGSVNSSSFAQINWGSANTRFLKVEISPDFSTNYPSALSGTTQLMSVPYAFYAANTNPSTTIQNISNIASLRNVIGKNFGDVVFVRGYSSDNDGGGGNFIWSNNNSPDDGGTIIKPASYAGNGRWIRVMEGQAFNVKWFGADGNGGDKASTTLITKNNTAFQNALRALKLKKRELDPNMTYVNRLSKSGIFIPSGEYVIGEDALFFEDPSPDLRLEGLNYFSDGQAILSLTNKGVNTYAFKNKNQALYITFRDITFIGNDPSTNIFYSSSNGGAQDYFFERCNFFGNYNNVITLEGTDNNSEWGFIKCSFYGSNKNTVINSINGGSDQNLNYWFDQVKFWTKEGSVFKITKGGHYKFINCDWSGFEPTVDTYLFDLDRTDWSSMGVNDLRIINGRFELKNAHARVLRSNWDKGNIEISADFGSQTWRTDFSPISSKNFEFNIQTTNSLNVSFRNSVMAGYHEYNYLADSWQGTGNFEYVNCSFPFRESLKDFIKINHGANTNKSGIADINISNANFKKSDQTYQSVRDVNYLPLYSKNIKKKYYKLANPQTATNPTGGQIFTLDFPVEAESIITNVTWYFPPMPGQPGQLKFELFRTTNNGEQIIAFTDPFDVKDGCNVTSSNLFINLKDTSDGKIKLRASISTSTITTEQFLCLIEYL